MHKCLHILLSPEAETPAKGRTISFCLHHPHKHTYSFSLHHPHITFVSSSEFRASPVFSFRTYLPVFFPCLPSHRYYSALHMSHLPAHQQRQSLTPTPYVSFPDVYFAMKLNSLISFGKQGYMHFLFVNEM